MEIVKLSLLLMVWQRSNAFPGWIEDESEELDWEIRSRLDMFRGDEEPVTARKVAVAKAVPNEDWSAQNRLLLKGGTVVNDDLMFEADVYVEDGIIRQVGRDLIIPGGTRTIDVRRKFIIPGGIDPHTHLDAEFQGMRSVDDFYSGTRAALAGGTTMIMDFVLPKQNQSLLEAYDEWRSRADPKVCCDFGLHMGVTWWSEKLRQEMDVLTKERGVSSFKFFMAYKNYIMLDDESILRVMSSCRDLGALAMVHAENGDLIDVNAQRLISQGVTGPEGHEQSRPEPVEAEAVNRAAIFANQTNCPLYVVHVMGKQAANVIAEKRKEGAILYGEVLGAALGTDGTHYYNKCWRHAAGHVVSPPLRPDPSTPAHLMDLLASGNLQVIASDHIPFNAQQKARGKNDFRLIPTGIGGVEERMMIAWEKGVMSGKLDPTQFVALTSTNAAKIFNLYPRKGRIAVGSDADIVVWDPALTRTISAKSHVSQGDFNVLEGITVRGGPSVVISAGRVALEDGQLKAVHGAGRFVPAPTHSPYIYMRVEERERNRVGIRVDREAYDGPVAEVRSLTLNGPSTPQRQEVIEAQNFSPSATTPEFHSRPTTKGGVRNLQDSSFSLSGAQIDDEKGVRAHIRVQNPPGGRSSHIW